MPWASWRSSSGGVTPRTQRARRHVQGNGRSAILTGPAPGDREVVNNGRPGYPPLKARGLPGRSDKLPRNESWGTPPAQAWSPPPAGPPPWLEQRKPSPMARRLRPPARHPLGDLYVFHTIPCHSVPPHSVRRPIRMSRGRVFACSLNGIAAPSYQEKCDSPAPGQTQYRSRLPQSQRHRYESPCKRAQDRR